MTPASASLLRAASVFGFVVVLLGVMGLFATHGLLALSPWSIGAQALAFLLLIWARLTFGLRSFHAAANPTAGGLVTTGPYHYVRHPIYAAVLLFVWSGALVHPTLLHLGFALVATAGTGVRIACEERLIVEAYPDYAAYGRATKRLIPGVF